MTGDVAGEPLSFSAPTLLYVSPFNEGALEVAHTLQRGTEGLQLTTAAPAWMKRAKRRSRAEEAAGSAAGHSGRKSFALASERRPSGGLADPFAFADLRRRTAELAAARKSSRKSSRARSTSQGSGKHLDRLMAISSPHGSRRSLPHVSFQPGAVPSSATADLAASPPQPADATAAQEAPAPAPALLGPPSIREECEADSSPAPPVGAAVGSVTHMLLFLHEATFEGDHGDRLCLELEAAKERPDVRIVLVHERRQGRGACSFERFLLQCPAYLVKMGLFSAIAHELHDCPPHQATALAMSALEMGAKPARPALRTGRSRPFALVLRGGAASPRAASPKPGPEPRGRTMLAAVLSGPAHEPHAPRALLGARQPRRDEVGPWRPIPVEHTLLRCTLDANLGGGSYALVEESPAADAAAADAPADAPARLGAAGVISPLRALSLTPSQRQKAGIPPQARYYAFAFPPVGAPRIDRPRRASDPRMLSRVGGYLYFQLEQNSFSRAMGSGRLARLELCGALALCAAARSEGGFRFAGPLQIGEDAALWEETLHRAGRLHDAGPNIEGLSELVALGVRRYCWLMPSEEVTPRKAGEEKWPNGGFLFCYDAPSLHCVFKLVSVASSKSAPPTAEANASGRASRACGATVATVTVGTVGRAGDEVGTQAAVQEPAAGAAALPTSAALSMVHLRPRLEVRDIGTQTVDSLSALHDRGLLDIAQEELKDAGQEARALHQPFSGTSVERAERTERSPSIGKDPAR